MSEQELSEDALEVIFDDIQQGLDPSPPCTCGTRPDESCEPCNQQMRGMRQLARLEKYVTALRSRIR